MKRSLLLAVVVSLALLLGLAERAQALDEKGCLRCHSNPKLTKVNGLGRPISLYVDEATLNRSAHRYLDCTTCHGLNPHDVGSPLTKLSLAQKCGSCHLYERTLHERSIHGQLLALGNQEVASCVDCHSLNNSPHGIERVLHYDSPAYRKNIAATCSGCHGDESLMANYGIVEKIYETYMRTYHGKAMQLADSDLRKLNTATCTNCHGVHNIMKTEDPRSPVASVENLAATCEQCHPGAGENFAASFMGHKEASPTNSPIVYYVERFFLLFTSSVVAFGVGIVALALLGMVIKGRGRKGLR